MYKIKIYNKIAEPGLKLLEEHGFTLIKEEESADRSYQGIVLRSHALQASDLNEDLMVICRAGTGVNNVPISACNEKGIVVFNTPGINANAVVELVIASLIMASRNLPSAIDALKAVPKQNRNRLPELAEDMKKQFQGREILGKTLGVVGLGAIGTRICRLALSLGMRVIGYDPYLSIHNAWNMSEAVIQADDLEMLFEKSHYVTLHLPSNDSTRGLINEKIFSNMQKDLYLLNFSRHDIVNTDDLLLALAQKKLGYYVSDFANEKLLEFSNVLLLPHLGASTREAEENCAISACEKALNYLRYGSIINSVNFPDMALDLKRNVKMRIVILHDNIPQMISRISEIIGKEDLNIIDMLNRSKDDLACTLIDLESLPSADIVSKLSIESSIRLARSIEY